MIQKKENKQTKETNKKKNNVKQTTKTKITAEKSNKIKKNKTLSLLQKLSKKEVAFYLILFVVDISLIIYCAKKNIINYVSVFGNNPIMIGKTKNLFFGSNYINIIISLFIYLYIFLSNKFVFNKNYKKKFYLILLLLILCVNIILFFLFTKRVY